MTHIKKIAHVLSASLLATLSTLSYGAEQATIAFVDADGKPLAGKKGCTQVVNGDLIHVACPQILGIVASGKARTVRIKSTGTVTAEGLNINYNDIVQYADVIQTDDVFGTCQTLPPGATCTITFKPTGLVSATPGDTTPANPIFTLSYNNAPTSVLKRELAFVVAGSFYQDGFIYRINDTTDAALSIGGRVVSRSDLVGVNTWDLTALADDIETNATSVEDAIENTRLITCTLDQQTPIPNVCAGITPKNRPANTIAGASCYFYSTANDQGAKWFLPAPCDFTNNGITCTNTDNMRNRLIVPMVPNTGLTGIYWTSRESDTGNPNLDKFQAYRYNTGPANSLLPENKDVSRGVRCVHDLV